MNGSKQSLSTLCS